MIPPDEMRQLRLSLPLGLALLLAPLPFASAQPLFRTALLLFGLAFGALVVGTAKSWKALRERSVLLAAFVLLGALGLLQAVPLPASLAGLISPAHRAIWESAAAALGADAPGWLPLSLAPDRSVTAGLALLSYVALGAGSVVLGRHRLPRRVALWSLLAAAAAQLAFGFKGLAAAEPEIWGLPVQGPVNRLRGTFVNPNHAALYLEMCAAVIFAWGWWALRHARGSLTTDKRLLRFLPPMLAWTAVALAILFTGSRAGLAAFVVGLVAQLVMVLQPRRRKGRAVVTVALVAAVVSLIVGAAWVLGIGRWEMTSLYEDNLRARMEMTVPSLKLWARFPLMGTGLGSFSEAISMAEVTSPLRAAWTRAHNDLLELLVTGGLVGVLAALLGLTGLIQRLARVLAGPGRTENRAAPLAALGLVASVTVHELFDFGLTVPANAMTFAALVGLAAGVLTRPGASADPAVRSGPRSTPRRRAGGRRDS